MRHLGPQLAWGNALNSAMVRAAHVMGAAVVVLSGVASAQISGSLVEAWCPRRSTLFPSSASLLVWLRM